MLKIVDINEGLDRRKTTPADVLDALRGAVERGVEQVVLVCEDPDGTMHLLMTDMTNAECLGLLEIAKANFVHLFQHNVSQADYEVDS
jgi:aspartate/glutamate racemase